MHSSENNSCSGCRVTVSTPSGLLSVPIEYLDNLSIPSFVGTTKFSKDAYQEHRLLFSEMYPYDEVVGKKDPYTGEVVSSKADYELYCLLFYLKHSAEDELEELRTQNATLEKANAQLETSRSSAHQHADRCSRRLKTLSVAYLISLYVLVFSVLAIFSFFNLIAFEWISFVIIAPYCFTWCFVIISDWKKGHGFKHKFSFFVSIFSIVLSLLSSIFSRPN